MSKWPYNTGQWRRLRQQKISANPICEPCLARGAIRRTVIVDHHIAIRAGGEPFPPLSGLTSMCRSCHGEKTSATDRPDRRPGLGLLRGCDAEGRPLDPAHPFLAATPRGGHGRNPGEASLRPDGGVTKTLSFDEEGE